MKKSSILSFGILACLFLLPSLAGAQLAGYYKQSFEGTQFPPAGWQATSVQGANVWQRTSDEAYDGSFSAYMEYQSTGGQDWLITPKFQVASGDSLIFYMTLEYDGFPPDSLIVRASTGDSALASFTSTLLQLEEGVNYPLTAGVWQRYAVSLAPFVGQDIFVAFSHYNVDGDGVYIDRVQLGTLPALDAEASTYDGPAQIVANTSLTPQATVANNGPTPQSFNATLEIQGGYVSIVGAPNVAAGTSTQLSFTPWTPATPGVYQAKLYTGLAGDLVPSNDTLLFSITVMQDFENYGWNTFTPLPQPMWASASAFLKGCNSPTDSGYIYHISGNDMNFNTIANAYKMNVVSGAWSPIANLPTGKQQIGAAAIKGKVYVPGGYVGSFTPTTSAHAYDPATNTWTAIANMPTAVGDYAIASYADSLMYIVGGYNGTTDVTTVQIYNVNTNTWTTGTAFAGTAVSGGRMGITGNKIVLVGGYNQVTETSDQAWLGTINTSNPSQITWTALPSYPAGPSGRLAGGATPLNDGKVYFTAGDPDGQGLFVMNATFAFNVNTNQWEGGPDKPSSVSNVFNFVAFTANDSVYLACIGGYDGNDILDNVEAINVGALPQPTISSTTTTVCEGTSITFTATGGQSYLWEPAASFSDPTQAVQTITPAPGVSSIVGHVYQAWGCPLTDSIEVTVNAKPTAALGTFTTPCVYHSPFALSGGTPAGGTYSGAGVTAGIFSPGAAGIGSHTITYIYTSPEGCSDTTSGTLSVSACAGLEEEEGFAFSIYPNPFREQFVIQAETAGIEKTEVFNAVGQLVYSNQNPAAIQTIDLNGFESGVYIIRVYSADKTITRKIIKQ